MCGITGVFSFTNNGSKFLQQINDATQAMLHRGPDHQATFFHERVALGHVRLSIIDTDSRANQPFTEESGRYTIVFNGEVFNFELLKQELVKLGYSFSTTSDTEVVLKSYIQYGETCLSSFNGFFAFAIYDGETETLFIARDRMGIKPLHLFIDDEKLLFASEMKSLLAYSIPRKLDYCTLYQYLQLNYVPSPWSMIEGVEKMQPGTWIRVSKKETKKGSYYTIPHTSQIPEYSYIEAQQRLLVLMDAAVERRLISDVPLGSFLSGGIDSSIIATIAAKKISGLNTFSIGYADEPMFDETEYAELVAKKIGSHHHVFKLTNNELFSSLNRVLNYIDEPFADSSALAVNLLCYYTKQHVTVALSGDGADELFSGYNKHAAELKARSNSFVNMMVKGGAPLWRNLPQSRNGKWTNIVRQLDRFSDGLNQSTPERYWHWATISNEKEALNLMVNSPEMSEYISRKSEILQPLIRSNSFNEVLYTDLNLVLQGDMLVKVDLMSMDHALEVRTPFLDYTLVDFVAKLPVEYKIDSKVRKKILQESYRSILPKELFNRKKHGFEVPLLKWFQTDLKSLITEDLLSDAFIEEQGVFNSKEVFLLKQRLFSSNPGDSAAKVWALIVFQFWWKKYF
ncbi:MAG: asparagine synthase (glutamine-hydrolyzing) [Bacteroidota bacterium]